MDPFHVGIDFGTSQTKVCIKNLVRNNYFFHLFAGEKLFLPSSIAVNSQGNCSIGTAGPNQILYFKMAALEDDGFQHIFESNNIKAPLRYSLSQVTIAPPSNQDELASFPEICCILYLAYVILDIQASLQKVEQVEAVEKQEIPARSFEKKVPITKEKGLFERLFSIFKKDELEPTIQSISENTAEPVLRKTRQIIKPKLLLTIGIPTEYDSHYQERRRNKMYQMLLMAKKLADREGSLDMFQSATLSEHVNNLQQIYAKLIQGKTKGQLETAYSDAGIFVVAETTAGIEPIRNERVRMLEQILNSSGSSKYQQYNKFKQNYAGCYMTMDIGAGTTDISFFNMVVSGNGEVNLQYYSSQPVPYASNQLIANFLKGNDFQRIASFDFSMTSTPEWRRSQKHSRTELYRIINGYGSNNPDQSVFGRVRLIFKKNKLSLKTHWNYQDPPPFVIAKGCYVYGGGSRFKEFSSGVLELDHGGGNNPTMTELKKLIEGNELINNILLTDKEGMPLQDTRRIEVAKELDMLNVALGLAMLSPGNRPGKWIDPTHYLTGFIPTNIDPDDGIFDFFKRKWI